MKTTYKCIVIVPILMATMACRTHKYSYLKDFDRLAMDTFLSHLVKDSFIGSCYFTWRFQEMDEKILVEKWKSNNVVYLFEKDKAAVIRLRYEHHAYFIDQQYGIHYYPLQIDSAGFWKKPDCPITFTGRANRLIMARMNFYGYTDSISFASNQCSCDSINVCRIFNSRF